jgi:hypothetical protein
MKPKRCNQSGSSQTSQGSTGNDDYNEVKIRSITRLRDKLNQKLAELYCPNQIGGDLKRIKKMGVEHIIFGYDFLPIARDDISNMIGITKQLSKFCR